MKVLNISDDSELTEKINFSLEKLGIAVINYRWFLKALDNIEEIKPDAILINVSEYPRHWKTLCQFVKLSSWSIKVILILREKLSEEDTRKAQTLGAETVINDSFFDKNLTSALEGSINETDKTVESHVKSGAEINDSAVEEDDEIPSVSSILMNNQTTDESISDKKSDKKPVSGSSRKKYGSLLKRISNQYEK